jgi:chemotaxis protein MotB
MTYADTITLLLCLFVVLLSYASTGKGSLQRLEAPPTAGQPAGPVDFMEGNLPFHGLPRAGQPTEDADDAIAETAGARQDRSSAPPPVQAVPERMARIAAVPVAVQPASQAAASAGAQPISLPAAVTDLQSQGAATVEQKGDRLTTIEISSAAFFGSGSATLSGPGRAILQDVAASLGSDKLKDYQVTVEGHTDDSPISTPQFPSNWELSTARASAVVHFLLEQGIPALRLRAAGYADTFPIAANRDQAGYAIPENQARNRRVVIKLEKVDKPQQAVGSG